MGKLKYFLFPILFFVLPTATEAMAATEIEHALPGLELEIDSGYRVDQFDWNIAGDLSGSNPNVLSELTWKDLEILQLDIRVSKTINRIYLRGAFGYGIIIDGVNQDSDFNGDDRTLEYSRSNNMADNGSVWDATLGAGYTAWILKAGDGRISITPLLGVSFHKQNLKITDGFQTIPPTGPFSGLDSSYSALWIGPWLGADIGYRAERLNLYTSFEFHAAAYRAEADWNLRPDFQHPKSFEHSADALGVVVRLGGDYDLSRNWSITAGIEHQDWRAFDGTDRTFLSNGTVSDTRLNEVNWMSNIFKVGLKYRF